MKSCECHSIYRENRKTTNIHQSASQGDDNITIRHKHLNLRDIQMKSYNLSGLQRSALLSCHSVTRWRDKGFTSMLHEPARDVVFIPYDQTCQRVLPWPTMQCDRQQLGQSSVDIKDISVWSR